MNEWLVRRCSGVSELSDAAGRFMGGGWVDWIGLDWTGLDWIGGCAVRTCVRAAHGGGW